MKLTTIHLQNFRSFADQVFDIDHTCTIVVGKNARGKTNLLESIYMSVQGTGFRQETEEDLIRWDALQCVVESMWYTKTDRMRFGVHLSRSGTSTSKHYFVQKSPKSGTDYTSYQTAAVLFAPEHMDIVSGAPRVRRAYIDGILSRVDPEYKKRLRNYTHAMVKRNKILERAKIQRNVEEELVFWDGYLEEQARYISGKRAEYVSFLTSHPTIDERGCTVTYVQSEFNRERARQVRADDLRYRRTTIGPHKDEFIFRLGGATPKLVRQFGSRSEQRLVVFWLKLNEIRYYEQELAMKPILLLDDIFSELDTYNKQLILKLIGEYQSVLTSTEDNIPELKNDSPRFIRLP